MADEHHRALVIRPSRGLDDRLHGCARREPFRSVEFDFERFGSLLRAQRRAGNHLGARRQTLLQPRGDGGGLLAAFRRQSSREVVGAGLGGVLLVLGLLREAFACMTLASAVLVVASLVLLRRQRSIEMATLGAGAATPNSDSHLPLTPPVYPPRRVIKLTDTGEGTEIYSASDLEDAAQTIRGARPRPMFAATTTTTTDRSNRAASEATIHAVAPPGFGEDTDLGWRAREQGAELVIGSRYREGGRVENWPVHRMMLSAFANQYIRAVTGLSVRDCTSGYRCWQRSALARLPLDSVASEGYAFLTEVIFQAAARGIRVAEVPIVFVERRHGASKLSGRVIAESVLLPWRLAARPRTRRV